MSIGSEGFVLERPLRSQPQHGLRPCRSGAGEAERSPALAGLTRVRRGLSRAISASFSADKSNESTRVRRGQSRSAGLHSLPFLSPSLTFLYRAPVRRQEFPRACADPRLSPPFSATTPGQWWKKWCVHKSK